MTELQIYKVFDNAIIPSYGTENASCFDISCCLINEDRITVIDDYNYQSSVKVIDEKITLYPGQRMLVPTGLIFQFKIGYSLRIHPRSGLSLKKGIMLGNCEGIIDSDYFHPTFVLLYNSSKSEFSLSHGDRIAQGELVKDIKVSMTVTTIKPSQTTDRIGGFGSTGIEKS